MQAILNFLQRLPSFEEEDRCTPLASVKDFQMSNIFAAPQNVNTVRY
jgi:hypothetical protein